MDQEIFWPDLQRIQFKTTGRVSAPWRPGKSTPRKKRLDFTDRTAQGKTEASSPLYVAEKIGIGMKRILSDEFGIDSEAKGGRIHAKAWAGNKVMPIFEAWGLIVFFRFKRFQWDKNRIYHVEIS